MRESLVLSGPSLLTLGFWEDWFVDVEETHTSSPALVFFRSPQPSTRG